MDAEDDHNRWMTKEGAHGNGNERIKFKALRVLGEDANLVRKVSSNETSEKDMGAKQLRARLINRKSSSERNIRIQHTNEIFNANTGAPDFETIQEETRKLRALKRLGLDFGSGVQKLAERLKSRQDEYSHIRYGVSAPKNAENNTRGLHRRAKTESSFSPKTLRKIGGGAQAITKKVTDKIKHRRNKTATFAETGPNPSQQEWTDTKMNPTNSKALQMPGERAGQNIQSQGVNTSLDSSSAPSKPGYSKKALQMLGERGSSLQSPKTPPRIPSHLMGSDPLENHSSPKALRLLGHGAVTGPDYTTTNASIAKAGWMAEKSSSVWSPRRYWYELSDEECALYSYEIKLEFENCTEPKRKQKRERTILKDSLVACTSHGKCLQLMFRNGNCMTLVCDYEDLATEWKTAIKRTFERFRRISLPSNVMVDDIDSNTRTGDVLLFRIDAASSTLQRVFTNSKWDHCAIVIPIEWAIMDSFYACDREKWALLEANHEGGVFTTPLRARLKQYFMESTKRVAIRRILHDSFEDESGKAKSMEKLREFVRSSIGKPYSFKKMLRIATGSTTRQGQNAPFSSFEYDNSLGEGEVLSDSTIQSESESESDGSFAKPGKKSITRKKTSHLEDGVDDDEGFFCSELVARSLKILGILDKERSREGYYYWPKSFMYGHEIDQHLAQGVTLSIEIDIQF